MPWDSGSAADHEDLLNKLETFLTGGALVNVSGTQIPSNQVWTILKDVINPSTSVYTNQIGLTREVYLRAPGLAATAVDITSVSNNGSGVARFNFTPGPTLAVTQEVILSGFTSNPSYNGVYLVDTTAAGYFEVDSISFGTTETGSFLINAEAIFTSIRRYSAASGTGGDADNFELTAAINFNTLLDFRYQPGSPAYTLSTITPYIPLSGESFDYWFVATGRYYLVAVKISTTTSIFGGGFYLPYALPSEFPYPILIFGTASAYNTRWSAATAINSNFYSGTTSYNRAALRHRDGEWLRVYQQTGSAPTAATCAISPVHQTDTFKIRSNQDESYTALPYIFYSGYDGGNVYGEMENLYWVSSFNIAALDVVQIDSVDHLVLQNVWDTNTNTDFCVLRLE
jgi:hypothetical protein